MFLTNNRKNTNSAISACLNWRHSLVCADLNGKIFSLTAGFRRKFSNIFRLSLSGNETLKFNIMDEITEKNAYRDAFMTADTLLARFESSPLGGSENTADAAKDLLTGAILHCKCSDYRHKSMHGVLSFLQSNMNDDKNKTASVFGQMANSCHCSSEIHEIIRNVVNRLKILPKNKINCLFSLVLNALKIFDDPVMRDFSDSSDFCLNDFKVSSKPFSLFITTPSSSFEMFYPYTAVMLNMINHTLSENETNLKNPVFALLDEHFNDKRYLNNIDDNISVCFYKPRPFEKKKNLFGFLYNKKINLPVLKGRNEFLFECADTSKPNPYKRQWFHIPEEMYMSSDYDVFEPIFTSKIPENEHKDMELIPYQSIPDINLFFNDELKENINKLRNILKKDNYNEIKKRFFEKGNKCGIICMLFGEPGTGKTEAVLQLAKKTKRDLLKVDISIVRKRYVGQSEKAVNRMFSEYKNIYEQSDNVPILFINEADGLFQKRTGDIDNSVNKTLALDFNTNQNLLLDKLENFEGIMIGTSNFIENMDRAFDRRILYKVSFFKPDRETQKQIWKNKLPELENETTEKLADNFDFTGGIINNIVKKRGIDYILTGEETNYDNLEKLCKTEFQIKKDKRIGF